MGMPYHDIHVRTYIHTCTHTYVHTKKQTYIHTYTPQAGLRAPAGSRQWDIYIYIYTYMYVYISCRGHVMRKYSYTYVNMRNVMSYRVV